MTPEWVIEELEEAGHDEALHLVVGESDPDARRALRERGLSVPSDVAEWASDPVVESPSGWSFRESQENGDQVDCRECGDPLDDGYPIVNDAEGYAYHAGCGMAYVIGNDEPLDPEVPEYWSLRDGWVPASQLDRIDVFTEREHRTLNLPLGGRWVRRDRAGAETCVVCIVGNGDLDHDHLEHQVVDYHEVDGTPTSEPCPGVGDCPDCQSVLAQL